MTKTPKFICTRWTGEIRTFATREEALRFVRREGDASRLWSIEER